MPEILALIHEAVRGRSTSAMTYQILILGYSGKCKWIHEVVGWVGSRL